MSLIITGHAYVSEEGQAGPFQLGIYHDELIPAYAALASAVHQSGGKIVMQLAHAGVSSSHPSSTSGLYKKKIGTPLVLVGGIRSYEVAEKLVRQGNTDYVALCRPLISEPGLVNRWKSGDTGRAVCRSDNLCFKPGMEGRGVYCVTAERQRKRQEHQEG